MTGHDAESRARSNLSDWCEQAGDRIGMPRSWDKMNLRNSGRSNIQKARIFLEHLSDFEDSQFDDDDMEGSDYPLDIALAEAYLDAAIVFGKATQDWLENDLGKDWLRGSELWNDPICQFFAETRHTVVHEDGSVHVVAVVDDAHLGHSAIEGFESHPQAMVTHRLHFEHSDPAINGTIAIRLVNDYLDLLENMVDSATDGEQAKPKPLA